MTSDPAPLNNHGRDLELLAVWYVGPNETRSLPLSGIKVGEKEWGRKPDAFGVYEIESDGTQVHVTDEPTLEQARAFASDFK